jgi:hypothetical protein
VPYFEEQKEKLGLPPDQCSIWLIDCWSVHHSEEFLSWMWKTHSTIIIIFVPAGSRHFCTNGDHWLWDQSHAEPNSWLALESIQCCQQARYHQEGVSVLTQLTSSWCLVMLLAGLGRL